MAANPAPGATVRQEFALDEAEDLARYESVGGTLDPHWHLPDVVKTFDYNPLEPEAKENKYYAPNIGIVATVDLATGEREDLVRSSPSPAGGAGAPSRLPPSGRPHALRTQAQAAYGLPAPIAAAIVRVDPVIVEAAEVAARMRPGSSVQSAENTRFDGCR